MSKWIKISEAKPVLERDVLITDGKIIEVGHLWQCNDRQLWTISEGIMGHDAEFTFLDENVTHWMELPKLP